MDVTTTYSRYVKYGPQPFKPVLECRTHAPTKQYDGWCEECLTQLPRLKEWCTLARPEDWCGFTDCGECFPDFCADTREEVYDNPRAKSHTQARHQKWLRHKPTYQNPDPVCANCEENWAYCTCLECKQCAKVFAPFYQNDALGRPGHWCPVCGGHPECNCDCSTCAGCDVKKRPADCCPSPANDDGHARCFDCCGHPQCTYCGVHFLANPRDECQHNCVAHQRTCRACGGMEYVRARDVKHVTSDLRSFKRNPIKRLLGVEIECYAERWKNTAKVVTKWGAGIVKDGSIEPAKSGQHGIEVTTAPAMGGLFVRQGIELTEALWKDKAEVNTSCGLHVHVDASSYKWWDVQRLIKLYAKLEQPLFAALAPYRRRSDYCRPCGQRFMNDFVLGLKDVKGLKKRLLKHIYSLNTDERLNKALVESNYTHKYNNHRYNALNIHSWFRRGTIEFRHHHGTLTQNTILNWAILCGSIVSTAERLSDAAIKELDADSAIEAVMPTAEVRDWYHERVRYMQGMTYEAADEQGRAAGYDDDDNEHRCDGCNNYEGNCSCCGDCNSDPCECCSQCGYAGDNCECCRDCGQHSCDCA